MNDIKILFYRYGNICETDIIQEFNKIGIYVETIEAEISNKKITELQRIDILNEALSHGEYLFVFSMNFFPSISDLCNVYGKPYVCWVVDAPVIELFSTAVSNQCNLIFCFDRHQYNEIKQFNPEHIYYLPLGTNVNRWDRTVASITDLDRKKFAGNISFVGSLYTEKDVLASMEKTEYLTGYLDGIYGMQHQFQGVNLIHGIEDYRVFDEIKTKLSDRMMDEGNFVIDINKYIITRHLIGFHISSRERIDFLSSISKKFDVNLFTRSMGIPTNMNAGLHLCGGVSTFAEMPKVFNLSKINLNLTIRSIETGGPLRIWDIMGCGGFLLTNYQEDITEYLVAGEDYDFFVDEGDLIEKCDFYLKNDGIRENIVRNGYEKTKKYHTYMNRMPIIFEQVLKIFN